MLFLKGKSPALYYAQTLPHRSQSACFKEPAVIFGVVLRMSSQQTFGEQIVPCAHRPGVE